MNPEKTAPTTALENPEGSAKPRNLSLLASEVFGKDFIGEVKPEAEPEPEASSEKTSEDEPKGETEDESTPGDEGEGSEKETDEAPISSVSELIASLEADPEWFNGLKVQVKVDGKPAETSIADLVKSYQIGEAAEHRLEEAKSKAKSLTEELAKKSEDLKGHFAQAAALITAAEDMLDSDVKAIDWNKLREDDPAEYSARKADMAERRQRIETLKRGAVIAWNQGQEKAVTEGQERFKGYIQVERAALLEKIPEWRDEAKAKGEKAKLAEYLFKQGFSQEDVMGASDHRLILVARKAMLFDEGVSRVDAARKKVAKVPKMVKPGAPKPKEAIDRERMAQAKDRLTKTGSVDAALAYLHAKRGGK